MYQTEIINLSIGEHSFRLHQVTNVDEVFESLIQADPSSIEVIDERIPYWTELWPAAIAMSEYILDHAESLKDKTVLEVACGLGLPSIAAGTIGAKVIASDYIQDAVDFAEKNWNANHQHPASFEVLDWRAIQLHTWPDVILASDIAYEKRFQDLLPSVINDWVQHGVEVIFTEPGRSTAIDFISTLKSSPHLQTFEVKTVQWRTVSTRVNVMIFRLNK